MLKNIKLLALGTLVFVGDKALSLYKIEISKNHLQEFIESKFPVHREKLLFSVTLLEPSIKLQEETQRIGIEFTVSVKMPGDVNVQWECFVDGQLHYRRDKGEFYFLDLKIHNFNLPVALSRVHGAIQPIVENLLRNMLAEVPIYKLDDHDTSHLFMRLILKNVRVGEDKLIVELGLY